jgi:hypothetical protein
MYNKLLCFKFVVEEVVVLQLLVREIVVQQVFMLQVVVEEVVVLQLVVREIVVQQVVMPQVVVEEAVVLQIVVGEIVVQQIVVEEAVVSQPIALERQYMSYPELLVPPGTQGQGPCLEEGPILGGRFWGLFPNVVPQVVMLQVVVLQVVVVRVVVLQIVVQQDVVLVLPRNYLKHDFGCSGRLKPAQSFCSLGPHTFVCVIVASQRLVVSYTTSLRPMRCPSTDGPPLWTARSGPHRSPGLPPTRAEGVALANEWPCIKRPMRDGLIVGHWFQEYPSASLAVALATLTELLVPSTNDVDCLSGGARPHRHGQRC